VEGLQLGGPDWHNVENQETSASAEHKSVTEVDEASRDLEDWNGAQVAGAGVLVLALVLVPEFHGKAGTDLHNGGGPSHWHLPELGHGNLGEEQEMRLDGHTDDVHTGAEDHGWHDEASRSSEGGEGNGEPGGEVGEQAKSEQRVDVGLLDGRVFHVAHDGAQHGVRRGIVDDHEVNRKKVYGFPHPSDTGLETHFGCPLRGSAGLVSCV